MAVHVGYQKANKCTGGPQPGARGMMAWFLAKYKAKGGINTGIYNCVGGDTLVQTDKGDFPIAELAQAGSARLLTYDLKSAAPRGKWVDAEVRSFGEQELYEVKLSRKGDERTILATGGHRWYTRYRKSGADGGGFGHVERTTLDLAEGHVIPTVLPRSTASLVRHMGGGIPHGIVYGDGTIDRAGGARIVLCGEKDAPLARYFPNGVSSEGSTPGGVATATITGLSSTWKALPSLNESTAYLYGFLAGWFAADGRVTEGGSATLYAKSREALETARTIARRVGISTYPVREATFGSGTENECRGHALTFVGQTLAESFFLIDAHRERWNSAPKSKRPDDWKVVSVEPTGRRETVFCAVVPETENFVLAEGVLTGNCRPVRGGRTTSLHGEGRAVDLGIRPLRAKYGTALAEALRKNSKELGIQCIIWNRKIWSGSYPHAGWRPYKGQADHYDHLHVELTWAAARRTESAMVARLNKYVGDVGKLKVSAKPAVKASKWRKVKYGDMLRRGVAGPPVLEWQRTALGYTGKKADSYFGAGTESDTRAFQRKHGLSVDGIVGPKTWKARHKGKPATTKAKKSVSAFPLPKGHWFGVPSRSSKNHSGHYKKDRPGVEAVQRHLRRHGHRVSVDGRFGDKTRRAVIAFQKRHKLRADGLVGVKTWAKLAA